MDIIRDLGEEMGKNPAVIDYCRNHDLACQFYAALCNMDWRPIDDLPEDEKIINRLKGISSSVWSCSWRRAGAIIAGIRTTHHGIKEDYMSFYCAGNEGHVSDLVRECFKKMGWVPEHEFGINDAD